MGDRCNAGETYVIYGGLSLPATIDLSSTSADLTVYGDEAGDASGTSVAAGDVSGDGIDDLVIGADSADAGGGALAGETYVIYGGGSLPASIDLNSTSADLTVYGDDASDHLGVSVAAGDISGDGTHDLIVGAMLADPAGGIDAGESYVIYGGTSLPASIDLDSASADVTVYGDDEGDGAGFPVAAGDVNGDGIDDLMIGAYLADPAGGNFAGETYVIYGGTSLPATIDLDSASASLTVYGDDEEDFSGGAVAAGDINGDGIDDLIIGAAAADPAGGDAAGETYVIYGSPSLPGIIDLDNPTTPANFMVYGADPTDYSGNAVAAGDINADGTDDLIVGAYSADGSGAGTSCGTDQVGDRCIAGETYVTYGSPPDGVGDVCDNCPDHYNPDQDNNVHPSTPEGDHCDDPDADLVFDITDNCPDDWNPDQTNTDVIVNPPGDALGDVCDPDDDNDQWEDDDEAVITTDPLDNCTDQPGDNDAWPPDTASATSGCGIPDTDVNILDVSCYKPKLPPNPYDPRYDLDASGEVNILDVLMYKPVLGASCPNP